MVTAARPRPSLQNYKLARLQFTVLPVHLFQLNPHIQPRAAAPAPSASSGLPFALAPPPRRHVLRGRGRTRELRRDWRCPGDRRDAVASGRPRVTEKQNGWNPFAPSSDTSPAGVALYQPRSCLARPPGPEGPKQGAGC